MLHRRGGVTVAMMGFIFALILSLSTAVTSLTVTAIQAKNAVINSEEALRIARSNELTLGKMEIHLEYIRKCMEE